MKRHHATRKRTQWAAHSFQLRFRHAPCSPHSACLVKEWECTTVLILYLFNFEQL